MSARSSEAGPHGVEPKHHDFLNGIVHVFLDNNFSIILIVVSALIGLGALLVTAREEDPQIVVPLADVIVNMPGYSASEVEELAATPQFRPNLSKSSPPALGSNENKLAFDNLEVVIIDKE